MFTLSSELKFQLYGQATDMRKSFDGLCGLVKNNLWELPLNVDVFVFINKNRNKMKLLHWKGSGFVLYYKRLKKGCPLALGRKNYLFAGSHRAEQKAAMMYSFFTTCKINDIKPLEWLTFVLERIQDYKSSQLKELLPQNWKTIKN